MKEIAGLDELQGLSDLAIIVNCNTKGVTTLALLSALAHATFPVLLIDCESKDGSRTHFESLSQSTGREFFWLSWPLRLHGRTLDKIFRDIPVQNVLLVDSDAEIPNAKLIVEMREHLDVTCPAI